MKNDVLTNNLVVFIRENQDAFYRFAFRYMKNEQESLDAVQETIVKSIEKIYMLKKPEYMKTWFYRILINECLTALRKNRKIMYINEYIDIPCYDESIESKEEIKAVFEAIDNLNEKYKTVIVLRYYEDMKLDEISYILKLNVNTVKSRLYRGLEILRSSLKEEAKVIIDKLTI
ncbi:sigma-70 family RNA polymerase sigma factor [Sedimentibacter sp. zth1]|uniref:RNA polymerase sigma factor n=1 Tax=Sedimentibacter sp. zth1 TaxID=2816908 RepID=UPI001A921248|nr:sigma-70 family RNA polymerase sigma factor [Sedimentibacter sp. zth1]QSX06871.1 sigma-70 family RNA polymerase sigma factor [Sedimentibacter sp. zth1]